jgi:hypothetical protein
MRASDPMNGHLARRLSQEASSASSDEVGPTGAALQALGALALGAAAIGALAIGALAIGRLAVGRAQIRRLEIDELVVRRLRIIEALEGPPQSGAEE